MSSGRRRRRHSESTSRLVFRPLGHERLESRDLLAGDLETSFGDNFAVTRFNTDGSLAAAAETAGEVMGTISLEADGVGLEAASLQLAAANGPFPVQETFKLHSRPGSNFTVFLDFDGNVTTGTTWNSAYGFNTIINPPYDINGDFNSFNSTELDRIQQVWQRVAEDFAPFDIDVTTQDPGSEALRKSGVGDTQWGVRVVVTDDTFANCRCGGHAYIGAFEDATDEPAYVYNSGLNGISEAASHEVGHALNLAHDGTLSGVTYYGGHGSGNTDWAPVMGNSYNANVTTWDNGVYYNANNGAASSNYSNGPDDLTVVTTTNGFGFAPDDHGDSTGTASELVLSNSTSVSAFGIIGQNTDVDYFSFTTGAGNVSLTLSPLGNRPNLDIWAGIYNSGGTLVAQSNPSGVLSATFTNVSLSAGTHFVKVDGVGTHGTYNVVTDSVDDPASPAPWEVSPPTGYSDYASLGQYSISGVIVAPSTDTFSIAADDADKKEGDSGTTNFTFTVTRNGNTGASASVDYTVMTALPDAAGDNYPFTVNGADFTGGVLPGGTVSFLVGETTKTVTLGVAGDPDFEEDEMFEVVLSNPTSSWALAQSAAFGTIQSDENQVAFALTNSEFVRQNEGDAGGGSAFTYTVTRAGDSSVSTTVDWAVETAGLTDPANASDFSGGAFPSGQVSFAPGVTSAEISVSINGDIDLEPDENFLVRLSNATSTADVSIDSAFETVPGIIANDESFLTLTSTMFRWRQVAHSGGTFDNFGLDEISLANSTFADDFDPAVDSAQWTEIVNGTANTNFGGSGNSLFMSGESHRSATSRIVNPRSGDVLKFDLIFGNSSNGGEDVVLEYSVDGGATWTLISTYDTEAYVAWTTIQETVPAGADSGVPVDTEGNSGSKIFTFDVTRGGNLNKIVSVAWDVVGSGTNPANAADFSGGVLPGGALTFDVGQSSKPVVVLVAGDTLSELDETFDLVLSNPTGGPILNGSATATITNDDATRSTDEFVNGGSANRSGVAELSLEFEQAVTVSSATALQVYNHTTGNSINLAAATLQGNGTNTVTWDLSSVSLADGRYTAELPAAAATSTGGVPLARTHTFEYLVLLGDVSGDGAVNFADYGVVGSNFDPLPGTPYRAGDANGDGMVNFADYGVIGANFNPLGLDPLNYDFGDAPQASTNFPTTLSNDGAIHVIGSGLSLGASFDSESDGQPHANALGDDSNAGDDEDGVTFGSLTAGSTASITVLAEVPSNAVLNAWGDFNADGDWSDLGEQIFTNEPLTDGSNTLSFSVPASAAVGDTFARFRVTTSAGYAFTGLAPDGEVEDYQINIGASAGNSNGEVEDDQFTSTGEIHGQKWQDLDGDRVRDAGEPGLNGWEIQLFDDQGNLVGSQITMDLDLDSNGSINPETERGLYWFTGLDAGNYTVGEVQQAGWFQTSLVGSVAPDPNGFNVDKLSQLTISAFPGGNTKANDVTGYVSPAGREYAIIGLSHGTGYVDVTDPANPVIVGFISGADEASALPRDSSPEHTNSAAENSCSTGECEEASIWRDIKTFDEYAYVTNETGGGLQIIDLTQIDSGTVTEVGTLTASGLQRAHNIAINPDSGFAYLTGTNIAGGGLVAVDVGSNPAAPTIVGTWADRYIHDVEIISYTSGPAAGQEIAYGFAGGDGVNVIDVTNKAGMTTLARVPYPNVTYAHYGALSEDLQHLFVNDELDELNNSNVTTTTTYVFDVSTPASPVYLTSFTNGLPAIDHNLETRGDFLFEANYRSGLRVYDVSDVNNVQETGHYDTYPANDAAAFNGAWGVYSDLPSGVVLISDLESGLFVLDASMATGGLHTVVLGDGEIVSGIDFGNHRLASVTDEIVNGGSANRSGVAEISLVFDAAVTVSSATALRVYNHTTDSSINLTAASLQSNGTSTVTWDLSLVSLPDGRYTAELPAADATDVADLPLASAHSFEFHVLLGDVSGDAAVNFADYGVVGSNFDPLPGSHYRAGDADGNGVVNFADYGVIGANFNPLGLAALSYDLGDAPQASTNYPTTLAGGGAVHVIGSGLFLGASVDSESDGQPHADALGDDNAGDDEDGVTFGGLTAGSTASVTVVAAVPASAVLNAWADFNADGDWSDLGEQIFTNEPLTDGSNARSFSIPAAAAVGDTIARFRVTTSAGYSFTGLAPDGEVEDYQINIGASAAPSESGVALILFVVNPSYVESEYSVYKVEPVSLRQRSKEDLVERDRLPSSSSAKVPSPPRRRAPASMLAYSGLTDRVFEDALFLDELTSE